MISLAAPWRLSYVCLCVCEGRISLLLSVVLSWGEVFNGVRTEEEVSGSGAIVLEGISIGDGISGEERGTDVGIDDVGFIRWRLGWCNWMTGLEG